MDCLDSPDMHGCSSPSRNWLPNMEAPGTQLHLRNPVYTIVSLQTYSTNLVKYKEVWFQRPTLIDNSPSNHLKLKIENIQYSHDFQNFELLA